MVLYKNKWQNNNFKKNQISKYPQKNQTQKQTIIV